MGAQAGGIEGANATSDVLAGTAWDIVSIGGEGVPGDLGVVVEFGHDGRVSGSTGVNSYTASYSVAGDSVTFGPLAITRRAGDERAMAVEHLVVGSVAGRCPFWVDGADLDFEGPLGRVRCRMAGIPVEPDRSSETGADDRPRRPRPGPKPGPKQPPR